MARAQQSQFDRAMSGLRALVLEGAFAPGERLSEPVLAERLGLSRTPLRAAMSRLVEEGLLERVATGGCRVSSFSMADIIDAIEVRGTLEGLAVRVAAERGAAPGEVEACERLLDRIDGLLGADDPERFTSYVTWNAEFHVRLSQLSGSAVIRREVKRVSRLPLASPSAFLEGQEDAAEFRASLRLAQTQHRGILEAVTAREGARAEALAREHARLARRNLVAALSAKRDMSERIPGLALVAAPLKSKRR